MAKVTKIEVQKKNENRVNIYLDGEFFIGTFKEIIYKLNIRKDTDVDEESYIKAKNKAYSILNRAMQSEKQLRYKLFKREFSEETIDRVISKLKEYKMINDNEMAKSIVRDKKKFKKYGRKRIQQDLYKKKIDKDLIDNALEDELDSEEEYENALYLAKKKLKKIKDTDKRKVYQKLGRHLAYKGFEYDIVSKVIREVLDM
ncbi:regulatory protein RecX [Dethiothermospora halolimnae]|uniref:regulatory protein RecX n=1 Tax=Dethiothermospora halolimnae TaxID=3114390 RepID=UPI003CCC25DC